MSICVHSYVWHIYINIFIYVCVHTCGRLEADSEKTQWLIELDAVFRPQMQVRIICTTRASVVAAGAIATDSLAGQKVFTVMVADGKTSTTSKYSDVIRIVSGA